MGRVYRGRLGRLPGQRFGNSPVASITEAEVSSWFGSATANQSPFSGEALPILWGEPDQNINDGRGVTQLRSTYQIRIHGSIPGGLLQNLPPATEIVPAGLILRISQLDDAGLIGLLDALQIADIDVLEVRPEACTMEM